MPRGRKCLSNFFFHHALQCRPASSHCALWIGIRMHIGARSGTRCPIAEEAIRCSMIARPTQVCEVRSTSAAHEHIKSRPTHSANIQHCRRHAAVLDKRLQKLQITLPRVPMRCRAGAAPVLRLRAFIHGDTRALASCTSVSHWMQITKAHHVFRSATDGNIGSRHFPPTASPLHCPGGVESSTRGHNEPSANEGRRPMAAKACKPAVCRKR